MWTHVEDNFHLKSERCATNVSCFLFLPLSFLIIISLAVWSHKFTSDVSIKSSTRRRHKSLSWRRRCHTICHQSQVFSRQVRTGSSAGISTFSGEWWLSWLYNILLDGKRNSRVFLCHRNASRMRRCLRWTKLLITWRVFFSDEDRKWFIARFCTKQMFRCLYCFFSFSVVLVGNNKKPPAVWCIKKVNLLRIVLSERTMFVVCAFNRETKLFLSKSSNCFH